MEGTLRLLELCRRAEAVLSPGERIVRRGKGIHELFGVAQDIAPLEQLFLLALAQLRALKLGDLVAERIDTAGLLRLVHLKALDLLPRRAHRVVARRVGAQQRIHTAEAVKVRAMLLLIEQERTLVLAVDIEQVRPQCAQLRDRDGASIHAAGILAVGVDVTLKQQHAVLRLRPDLSEHGERGIYAVKLRADKRLGRSGSDQVTRGPRAEHRAERVNDDGFARACLTGEGVEARAEEDVRTLDHSDIFNVQQPKHGAASLT